MQDIRNIAVIAHVDHGKTTLVDKMMLAGKLFRDGQDNSGEVLDSNDLERERGITILSKNVSINWKGTKINILDTPGHSDFGGEVERVLNMADGCLLLVDAFEGPMPQTRFVLQKALQLGLKPIVVVNKVDKPNCRPEEVYEMVFDLMCDLDATEEQLDFSVVYGSAKNGWMGEDYNHPTDNIDYLLDKIIEVIPAPKQLEGTPQLLITSLDYSSYTGRIAVGRVHRGTLKDGMNVTICHRDGTQEKTKIKELHTFEGIGAMLILLALGVSRADALADYMLTNVYRREIIERFLADKPAAERDLLLPVEGVSEPMGAGAIDEILQRYPSYEAYFADEFGLDAARLKALRDFYLE